MLRNRYYCGYVTYQGVEYEGKHPRLISEELFNEVQHVLERHRQGGERAQRWTHYLKGTMRCGRCHSRLAYCVSRGNGGEYAYFFCLGRHHGRTDCDLPYLQPEAVEDAVTRHWGGESLDLNVRDAIRQSLMQELALADQRNERARNAHAAKLKQLRQDRIRWADKAMAGAVPDDIAREKQAAISRQMNHLEEQLRILEVSITDVAGIIDACLDLSNRCGDAYRLAGPQIKRDYNQAWWEWLEIDAEQEQRPVVKWQRAHTTHASHHDR
jgi:hypothetical protein